MQVQLIGFRPPIVGLENEFNTIRLGQTLAKRLKAGELVLLMCEKDKIAFGRATVVDIVTGELKQLCLLHGRFNHTELGRDDPEHSPDRLFAFIQKIYGPHIATEHKKSCVIYLRRLPDEFGTLEHDALRQA